MPDDKRISSKGDGNTNISGDYNIIIINIESRGALDALDEYIKSDRNIESRGVLDALDEYINSDRQKTERLEKELGLTREALSAFFGRLGETLPPLEQLAQRLMIHAAAFKHIAELDGSNPEIAALKTKAEKAIERGSFAEADEHLRQAENIEDKALYEAQQYVGKISLRKASIRAARGDTAWASEQLKEAAAHYAEAAKMLPEQEPAHLAYMMSRQAYVLSGYGALEGDNAALWEAVRIYRDLLELIPGKEVVPWVVTQNRLSNALRLLGERTGIDSLEQAVKVCQTVLEEQADLYDRAPLEWAMTQAHLGRALRAFGEREIGTDKLQQAVAALELALEEYKHHKIPSECAMTQNVLGITLKMIGERSDDKKTLQKAAATFRAALQECSLERDALLWGEIYNGLGNTLVRLGAYEEGIAAFHEALDGYTRKRAPYYWGQTQNNLGYALLVFGAQTEDTQKLQLAVEALRKALEERRRDISAYEWAMTQAVLGNALLALGTYEQDAEKLQQAVEALQLSLEERSRHKTPFEWAETQNVLGNALLRLGQVTVDKTILQRAKLALLDAQQLYLEISAKGSLVAGSQNNLDRIGFFLNQIEAMLRDPRPPPADTEPKR